MAPVPEEHLLDGRDTCAQQGKVAFGSRAWEVFREVDAERGGSSVEVLIYASHPVAGGRSKALATWRAIYVGHVQARAGAHPDGMTFRPRSTEKYESDNHGHWAVFWEIRDLRQLSSSEAIKISALRGLGKKKFYTPDFVPEGPIRIEYSWSAP